MIKNGNVEIGKTPCEETGKKSTIIKKGRALSEEKDVLDAFDKVAGYMDWDKWSQETFPNLKSTEDKKDA